MTPVTKAAETLLVIAKSDAEFDDAHPMRGAAITHMEDALKALAST